MNRIKLKKKKVNTFHSNKRRKIKSPYNERGAGDHNELFLYMYIVSKCMNFYHLIGGLMLGC